MFLDLHRSNFWIKSTVNLNNSYNKSLVKMEKVRECTDTVFWTLSTYSTWNLLCLVTVPLFGSVLNIYVHRTLEVSKNMCFGACVQKPCTTTCNTFCSTVLLFWLQGIWIVNYGTPIPGVNQVQFQDLVTECNKTREFLFVLPLLWLSFASFAVTITTTNTKSDYPVRTMFTCFCLVMFLMMSLSSS